MIVVLLTCDVCNRPLRTSDELAAGRHATCAHLAEVCEGQLDEAARAFQAIDRVMSE